MTEPRREGEDAIVFPIRPQANIRYGKPLGEERHMQVTESDSVTYKSEGSDEEGSKSRYMEAENSGLFIEESTDRLLSFNYLKAGYPPHET
jgi:hypothetical protein